MIPPSSSFNAQAAGDRAGAGHALSMPSDRQERLLAKAQDHYDRNKELWINKKFGELLRKSGNEPSFQPSWAQNDPKPRLMRAAIHLVQRKQASRISKIMSAGQNQKHELER